jgi:hypothetical protein
MIPTRKGPRKNKHAQLGAILTVRQA